MMTARELMTKEPVTVDPMATVRQATGLLQTLDVRHLPVVDDLGALVGMLSDRDLRSLSVPSYAGDEYVGTVQATPEANVASLMSSDVLSVEAEAPASEVVEIMLEHKIGAVPVVDADGMLVGIISYIDILRSLPLEADAAE
jgi:acetoin utilization protein AcuB